MLVSLGEIRFQALNIRRDHPVFLLPLLLPEVDAAESNQPTELEIAFTVLVVVVEVGCREHEKAWDAVVVLVVFRQVLDFYRLLRKVIEPLEVLNFLIVDLSILVHLR